MSIDMGVNRREQRPYKLPKQHRVQFQFCDKSPSLPKMMEPKKKSATRLTWERRKRYLFHKLPLSILLNLCKLLPPPQTARFWFLLLPLHFGSKVPSGHSEIDKILAGKYTVKEISPNAGSWRGRCINLEKDKTQGLKSSSQMQATEVIKILLWSCSYCSDVGTMCCTLLPRVLGGMGIQRAHQCCSASQYSNSIYSFRRYNSLRPHCNWWAAHSVQNFLFAPHHLGF